MSISLIHTITEETRCLRQLDRVSQRDVVRKVERRVEDVDIVPLLQADLGHAVVVYVGAAEVCDERVRSARRGRLATVRAHGLDLHRSGCRVVGTDEPAPGQARRQALVARLRHDGERILGRRDRAGVEAAAGYRVDQRADGHVPDVLRPGVRDGRVGDEREPVQ